MREFRFTLYIDLHIVAPISTKFDVIVENYLEEVVLKHFKPPKLFTSSIIRFLLLENCPSQNTVYFRSMELRKKKP
jgi:hypothetical protein